MLMHRQTEENPFNLQNSHKEDISFP
jgi:hypothetical protein